MKKLKNVNMMSIFGHNEWRGNQFIRSARPKGMNHPSYLPVIPMNGKSGIFRNCQVPMISYAWALRICSIRFSVIGCHCWVSQDYRRDSEPKEGVSLKTPDARQTLQPVGIASTTCVIERQMRMSTEQSGNSLLLKMKPIWACFKFRHEDVTKS